GTRPSVKDWLGGPSAQPQRVLTRRGWEPWAHDQLTPRTKSCNLRSTMRPIIPCCVFFFSVAMAVNAQNSTNAPVRQLSLAECIRSALERNLSLQVGDRVALGETADLDVRSGGRLGLEEARIAVHQSYSYYDPEFFTRISQNFNAIPP